jgi:hypothetical protein
MIFRYFYVLPQAYSSTNCDRTPSGRGVINQDQLERFLVKREYNQHIQVYNIILYIKVEVIKILQLRFTYLLY